MKQAYQTEIKVTFLTVWHFWGIIWLVRFIVNHALQAQEARRMPWAHTALFCWFGSDATHSLSLLFIVFTIRIYLKECLSSSKRQKPSSPLGSGEQQQQAWQTAATSQAQMLKQRIYCKCCVRW